MNGNLKKDTECEFLAQTLDSKQLLALLFICERKRKGQPIEVAHFSVAVAEDWEEMLATFESRFANLTETMRFEVLEAHLMSVEDLDIYHNETLEAVLTENQEALQFLTERLSHDPRF